MQQYKKFFFYHFERTFTMTTMQKHLFFQINIHE
jgi:hypothetical protein